MKLLALTKTVVERSGWGRYAAAVAREYARQGLDFQILTEINDSVSNHELGEQPMLLPLESSIVNVARNCWRTRRAARRADVVHAFDGWPYSVYGYMAVLGTEKKLFITGVATYSVAPFAYPRQRLLMAMAYRRAQNIFCVSRYTRVRILEKICLPNTSIVPWGPKLLPELSADEMIKYRQRFQIGHSGPIVVTVGQIKHRKGQYDTLKAIRRLRVRYPNILYLMVGETSDTYYVSKIRDYIAEHDLEQTARIIAHAETDRELAFFYSLCDLFVMNSNNDKEHFEGFGLVFLEAMQFGKPVVGSSGCGIADAIRDGYNGHLAPQGDDAAIASAVARVLDGDRASFSKNSKAMYRQFSWQKTVAEYVRNYRL